MKRSNFAYWLGTASLCAAVALGARDASAVDLILNGGTMTLGGVQRFDRVVLTNGARIVVPPFNGTDRVNTGNLELIAESISIDATSSIVADGAGYQPARCRDGTGPMSAPASGGRGGCGVRDSGGGGAHFGGGGRGTKDCTNGAAGCVFPRDFEEDCVGAQNAAMSACASYTDCRDNNALPTVAGQAFRHSIYDREFGAAGGDKGCRDNDGFDAAPAAGVGGAGGGRIVLVGLNATNTGAITINGTVSANGRRGCGNGNDSGGGGAGGTIFVVSDAVTVGTSARLTAGGGRGGDTQADPYCASIGAQQGGTCDDCGGGGGGGIINIQSRAVANLAQCAVFNVSGALGGVCTICQGEAGGSAGELQLSEAYVGEVCDGYDNDFDGMVDEGLGTTSCGLGMCARTINQCTSGSPTTCSPMVGADPSCRGAAGGARPRVAVILDSSASMLLDLQGVPTFGDGSTNHPGIDTNNDTRPNDSRLFLAKNSLAEVISAYPEIDFALARYHQDQAVNRSCSMASWIECQGLIASYDNPRDNTGTNACTLSYAARTGVPARTEPVACSDATAPTEQCINYAGTCGPSRRGADILAGFGMDTRDIVRWLDGRETNFVADETTGNVCNHRGGGDCELRGSGGTPLAGSLQAIEDYIVPIRATDPATMCRGYSVILVTDGAESCGGDPVAAARRLHDTFGVQVYVIAVSDLGAELASVDAISAAGSGGTRPRATVVTRPDQLVPALTAVISGSIRTERCNGVDDNCNGLIDEGFAGLGDACDDGRVGACRGTGTIQCRMDGAGTECRITRPGGMPGTEVCNGMDDNCNGRIDEGLMCGMTCTPTGPEVCNGMDDNCNGAIDESDPAVGTACGESRGTCRPGMQRCVRGRLECVGATGPRAEICNGLDDDCDGMNDNMAVCPGTSRCLEGACRRVCDPTLEFPCPLGQDCVRPTGSTMPFCVPSPCASCTANQRCVEGRCVDACEGVMCAAGQQCRRGVCLDCNSLGCAAGQLCVNSQCIADPCASVTCPSGQSCFSGTCRNNCDDRVCREGERCNAQGNCEPNPCATVQCAGSQQCVDGACREPACSAAMRCPVGNVCTAQRGCIVDPCATTRCEAGRVCRIGADGNAQCFINGGAERPRFDRVIAGGGYEPRCIVGPTPGHARGPNPYLVTILALAAAVAVVRRRFEG
ncbi:MAG: hypothetical protein JNK05_13690 [Myxococcales bacterium]|nr:hypothetical protein [Myxococcales bacterium]